MRKIVSILFLSLLLLQAIPVLHFFFSNKAVFYAYVDEEKPDTKAKEKLGGKEYIAVEISVLLPPAAERQYYPLVVKEYSCPHLERLTPPPNAGWLLLV